MGFGHVVKITKMGVSAATKWVAMRCERYEVVIETIAMHLVCVQHTALILAAAYFINYIFFILL